VEGVGIDRGIELELASARLQNFDLSCCATVQQDRCKPLEESARSR